MERELLERTLDGDLESAIKSLNELCLGSSAELETVFPTQPSTETNGESSVVVVSNNIPKNSAEWIEVFVNEMTSASSIDDAKARASMMLDVLEKSIRSEVSGVVDILYKEKMSLKEHWEKLSKYVVVLKQGVITQHARLKEAESRIEEVQLLKERVKKLESENYSLKFHLNQGQQRYPTMDRFPPHVF
ncbi:hypothetical protein IFM89_004791 [Coptis chinensis]|uniref:Uncharacterized protein n=1 Tax=Coptis chinensis TaxID=261450 RepID=A0A835IAX1_9MAGN|nr:hypothetical protein IFM89_004791 [Coptis chinensis]